MLLCCAGSCRALPGVTSWHIPWWPGRMLQQRAARQQASLRTTGRGVPMCMWNDIKESCGPSQLVFLSLDAAPSTVLHRCAHRSPSQPLVQSNPMHPTSAASLPYSNGASLTWTVSFLDAQGCIVNISTQHYGSLDFVLLSCCRAGKLQCVKLVQQLGFPYTQLKPDPP